MELKSFYRNNELVLTTAEIVYLNEYYKYNYNKVIDFNEFAVAVQDILDKSEAIAIEIKKQFDAQAALQPGILTETNIAATLAKIFDLPLVAHHNGYDRYTYSNGTTTLIQSGNPNSCDCILTIDGVSYKIETKEPLSKSSEKDLYYDENGKLFARTDIGEYAEYINYFNNHTNVFDWIGHNYSLNDIANLNELFDYLKDIDFLATYANDKLVMLEVNDKLNKIINLKGSEIRTAGKNLKSIFTKQYADSIISDCLVKETNDAYVFDKNKLTATTGRGTTNITRYKLNNVIMFKVESIVDEDENVITVRKRGVKQLSPTISLHLNFEQDYDKIYNILFSGEINE